MIFTPPILQNDNYFVLFSISFINNLAQLIKNQKRHSVPKIKQVTNNQKMQQQFIIKLTRQI